MIEEAGAINGDDNTSHALMVAIALARILTKLETGILRFQYREANQMKHWESLIDQKIREAMEQGEFDDLPGMGEPIDTSVNPFEDPEMRLAHRMLRNAGFAPSWIEERKDIEAELEIGRNQLARVWTIRQNARGSENERGAQARWQKAVTLFRTRVAELNRRIAAWNLKIPSAGLQRRLIDIEEEISRIERPDGNSRPD